MDLIVRNAEKIKNMVFKYNLTRSNFMFEKILCEIDRLRDGELKTYEQYLDELKTTRRMRGIH